MPEASGKYGTTPTWLARAAGTISASTPRASRLHSVWVPQNRVSDARRRPRG